MLGAPPGQLRSLSRPYTRLGFANELQVATEVASGTRLPDPTVDALALGRSTMRMGSFRTPTRGNTKIGPRDFLAEQEESERNQEEQAGIFKALMASIPPTAAFAFLLLPRSPALLLS